MTAPTPSVPTPGPTLGPTPALGATTTKTITTTVTATPTGASSTGATDVQIWTLIVAGGAVLATVVSAWLLRRTGRGQVEAAKQASAASERSAEAAEKSAHAAQESVGVNRETAAGVAQRAHQDALSRRYQEAAGQLGHNQAAVRLAGVYAMARLADEWEQERQSCVDVLCAYLRMPWETNIETPLSRGEHQVRLAIIKIIRSHLKETRPASQVSWSGLQYNFSSTTFLDADFSECVFDTEPDFYQCTFQGDGDFSLCTFKTGADFRNSRLVAGGALAFVEVEVHSDAVKLSRSKIEDHARLFIQPWLIRQRASIYVDNAIFDGACLLFLRKQDENQGTIFLTEMTLGSAGYLYINAAKKFSPPAADLVDFFPAVSAERLSISEGARLEIGKPYIDSGIIRWWKDRELDSRIILTEYRDDPNLDDD